MNNKPCRLNDFKPVWRIVVAMVLGQLAGSVIGILLRPHYSWFENSFFGGTAGTFPGFVFGVVWHIRSKPADRDWIGLTCALGFLSLVMTIIAFGFDLPQMQREMRNLERIRQLKSKNLKRIEVFDKHKRKCIIRITDPQTLKAFAEGIADAQGHSPNHPRYSDSWYVVITGPSHQFELHLNPRFPESVIGDIVVKFGNFTSYYGTFRSKGLRSWVNDHLIKANMNEQTGLQQDNQ